MFQIIWIIIAGLVIGLMARLILRGRQDIPLWLTAALGIVGELVGNVIASAIGVRPGPPEDRFRLRSATRSIGPVVPS
ncbi:GlsB/YeaQ/YmgE family stress response membrane protein, partial [Candidatus Frankia alpina]|uniref:GlsB/YeaQ/YmgE family stress response membrane protein n=1 Tax=Candidatus Frankia alpina TaxID=2699483 RepID=UPI001F43D97C